MDDTILVKIITLNNNNISIYVLCVNKMGNT